MKNTKTKLSPNRKSSEGNPYSSASNDSPKIRESNNNDDTKTILGRVIGFFSLVARVVGLKWCYDKYKSYRQPKEAGLETNAAQFFKEVRQGLQESGKEPKKTGFFARISNFFVTKTKVSAQTTEIIKQVQQKKENYQKTGVYDDRNIVAKDINNDKGETPNPTPYRNNKNIGNGEVKSRRPLALDESGLASPEDRAQILSRITSSNDFSRKLSQNEISVVEEMKEILARKKVVEGEIKLKQQEKAKSTVAGMLSHKFEQVEDLTEKVFCDQTARNIVDCSDKLGKLVVTSYEEAEKLAMKTVANAIVGASGQIEEAVNYVSYLAPTSVEKQKSKSTRAISLEQQNPSPSSELDSNISRDVDRAASRKILGESFSEKLSKEASKYSNDLEREVVVGKRIMEEKLAQEKRLAKERRQNEGFFTTVTRLGGNLLGGSSR
jgi:hypothetical protein